MLEAAHQRKAEGVDLAVAYLETHGRAETEAMLRDLESIPRKQVEYRGVLMPEMDVDAVLARHPQLALVDELAHTNAPGSRHPKRYQDVEELLAAGIDVYSTLNVQHLESLNDVVAQITGVTVHETIPDRVMMRRPSWSWSTCRPKSCCSGSRKARSMSPTRRRARSKSSSARATSPRCAS